MASENDAVDRSEEKRRWELAYFCLSRARKALRHMHNLSIENGRMSYEGFNASSSEMEDLVIALQHVYESCKILNLKWPDAVPRTPLGAANKFVRVWKAADADDLRNAYSHYAEALSCREHPLRDGCDSLKWPHLEAQ